MHLNNIKYLNGNMGEAERMTEVMWWVDTVIAKHTLMRLCQSNIYALQRNSFYYENLTITEFVPVILRRLVHKNAIKLFANN